MRTPNDPTKPGKMGDTEANDEQGGNSSSIEPKAPASRSFEQLNSSPPSQNTPNVRRSSIRPAPASFKPTLRDSAKLPPPMVIHSGDAEKDAPSWGDPELTSYPSHVKVEKPLASEPFALAEDLHLETLPLDLPKVPGIPTEARDIAESAQGAPASQRVVPGKPAVESVSPTLPSAPGLPSASVPEPRKPFVPVAIALVLLGLVVAVLVGRGRPSSSVATAETALPTAVALPTARALEAVVPNPAVAAADSAKAVESSEAARPNVPENAPDSVKPKDDSVVPVTVTLIPSDAKLVFRGVAVPGPPFVIDVPKGKKVSMEASRRNYVTRKVTLDSTKSEVTVGLVLDKKHR